MSDLTCDSEISISVNIYEENLNNETILDLSSQNLEVIPHINNDLICAIYLQNNITATLPEDFFTLLPNLMYLDLRDNFLTTLPKSIKNHRSLTHLLLQNNNIESLPDELGTVTSLKVIQLSGNPLIYPPRDIVMSGCSNILLFLRGKFIEDLFLESQSIVSEAPQIDCGLAEAQSYNSVLDKEKLHKTMSVQMSEKETESDEDSYSKIQGKCPKLPKSRSRILSAYSQSSKYLKPHRTCSKIVHDRNMKKSLLKDMDVKKKKEIIAAQEKILQGRRNLEVLKDWRKAYTYKQMFALSGSSVKRTYPYDTSPEYMTLLSREDIEKDLPDKYRKRLVRRSKQSIPRRDNADVQLAMKIKKLFENLEAIDLNRGDMTPRTEQRALLGEIHKISEIKQKLEELSSNNIKSVTVG